MHLRCHRDDHHGHRADRHRDHRGHPVRHHGRDRRRSCCPTSLASDPGSDATASLRETDDVLHPDALHHRGHRPAYRRASVRPDRHVRRGRDVHLGADRPWQHRRDRPDGACRSGLPDHRGDAEQGARNQRTRRTGCWQREERDHPASGPAWGHQHLAWGRSMRPGGHLQHPASGPRRHPAWHRAVHQADHPAEYQVVHPAWIQALRPQHRNPACPPRGRQLRGWRQAAEPGPDGRHHPERHQRPTQG